MTDYMETDRSSEGHGRGRGHKRAAEPVATGEAKNARQVWAAAPVFKPQVRGHMLGNVRHARRRSHPAWPTVTAQALIDVQASYPVACEPCISTYNP